MQEAATSTQETITNMQGTIITQEAVAIGMIWFVIFIKG